MPACRRKKMSSFQSNPLMKKENTFYSVNEGSKQTVFETSILHFSQHVHSSSINISVKRRRTRGRGVFFSTFFTILYWEIDFFWSKKVSFGSHERKILLTKL